ncbi:SH3 domain-containing protein [Clostridium subterminale]|uniref:SH3 domain-containing protein n=1 Tax=Clostridium subterminale TaxID=1550 RepID=UPI003CD07CA2
MVRNGASTDHSIQGELNFNEKITIIGKAGNWRQARYYNAPAKCNKVGWVSSAYLRITKDIYND